MSADSSAFLPLAELFRGCKDEIVQEWRGEAGELLRKLNLNHLALTDHIPETIDKILEDLAACRTSEILAQDAPESPGSHGIQRFYEGCDVGEVVTEYNLLRTAFATVAGRHGLEMPAEAVRIVNYRIDAAVRLAVMAFAQEQAQLRRKQADEHLAFLAHDLRTPLNAISLLVEELRISLHPALVADNAETFGMLQRNLSRVNDLITTVITAHGFTPVGEGAFTPACRSFELRPLVHQLLTDLDAVSAQQGITVTNAIPALLSVNADAGLISRVFQNLVSNAIKYSGGGQIIVTAAQNDDRVNCSVRDNGSGISPDLLGIIFEKNATDPKQPGSGLGLAIVKQIVEAHGGTISVESAPNRGATFFFNLAGGNYAPGSIPIVLPRPGT
jgi:two-component system, OmpR family, phosphate regulon sensor histidine kinase PhoR